MALVTHTSPPNVAATAWDMGIACLSREFTSPASTVNNSRMASPVGFFSGHGDSQRFQSIFPRDTGLTTFMNGIHEVSNFRQIRIGEGRQEVVGRILTASVPSKECRRSADKASYQDRPR